MNLFGKFWRWISAQVVTEVPEDDALCEFDCRKQQCSEGEWESCERRLHHAARELMPAKKPFAKPVAGSMPSQEQSSKAVAELTPGDGPASEAVDAID
jgi:hypothetical protein